MRRIFSFWVCLCVFSILSFAQDVVEPQAKKTVLVDYFIYPSNVKSGIADIVRNNVLQSVIESGRTVVIDVTSAKVQENEKLRRAGNDMLVDEANNMDRLSAIGVLGAEYVVSGQITNLTTTREETKDKDGKVKVNYSTKLQYAVKVIKVSDGTTVDTKSSTEYGSGDTEEASVASAAKSAGKVKKFIEEQFKVEGAIIEVSAEKKGKAEEVYINVGSNNGITKGKYFKVYAVRKVAGTEIKKEIGMIRVEAVEAGNASCCKVKDGGDVILKSFREGETLVVESYVKKTLIDRMDEALDNM